MAIKRVLCTGYVCDKDCHKLCKNYVSTKCTKYNKPPYVCDACSKRRYCYEDRYFYDARVADKKAHETRVSASTGAHLTNEELSSINLILKTGIKKGQPLSHLFATYENELIISERSAYRLIGEGYFDVRDGDLRRKTRYKKRRKKKKEDQVFLSRSSAKVDLIRTFSNIWKIAQTLVLLKLIQLRVRKAKEK